jgi:hypothetical protein
MLNSEQSRPWLSIQQAAIDAQVSPGTIRNWCLIYRIGHRVGGRWRINPAALAAMLDPAPEGAKGAQQAVGQTPETAQFIIRACNAHDDLLAALRELTIAAEASGWDVDADNAPILNAARAAIAKAGT